MPPRRNQKKADSPGYLRLQQLNFVRDLRFPDHLKGKASSYKSLLAAIVSRLDKKNRCFPGLKTLAGDAGLKSHTHVSTLLHEVQSLGLITIIPRTNSHGGRTSNEIEVLFPFDDPSQNLKGGHSSCEGHASASERGVPANESQLTNTNNKTTNRTKRKEEQQEVGVDLVGQRSATIPQIHQSSEETASSYPFPSVFDSYQTELEIDMSGVGVGNCLENCYLQGEVLNSCNSGSTVPTDKTLSQNVSETWRATDLVSQHIDWVMRGPGPRVSLWFELGRLAYPQSQNPKLKRFRSSYRLPHDQSTMLHALFEANGHFAAPMLAMCILEWSDFIPQWEDKYPRLDLIWTHGQELVAEYARRLYTLLFEAGKSPDCLDECQLRGWITRDPMREFFDVVTSGAINCTDK